jgi:hypothetical protein
MYDDYIHSCNLNYDGTKAVIAYAKSGMIFVWDLLVDAKKVKEIGENLRKNRAFTDEERALYFLGAVEE